MNEDSIVSSYAAILKHLSEECGFDLRDENFHDTPMRAAKAIRASTSGYRESPKQILSKTFPSDGYDQMIVVKDTSFFSTCAHHLLPFNGMVSVGYLPNREQKRIVGLSKIPRLIKCITRRFQTQERISVQIADAIEENLQPAGLGVIIRDSVHLCCRMRGIEAGHTTMDTSVLRGEFRDDQRVRDEFFRIVYGK